MSYLSICAVFRDEGPYLAEWVEFHLLQGVEHFYLYNHRSQDNYWEVLKPYVQQGIVTLIQFDRDPPQFAAYNDCLENFGKHNRWIAFIDIDEFLYAPDQKVSDLLASATYEQASNGKQIGAVAVRWNIFGSNGHETKTDGLVIERFTKRPALPDKHVKTIVKTAFGYRVGKNPHVFELQYDAVVVNEAGKVLPKEYAITAPEPNDVIRINHYHLKSREEYFNRKKLPDSGGGWPNTNLEERFRVHDLNEVEDFSAAKFALKIKYNIEARKNVK